MRFTTLGDWGKEPNNEVVRSIRVPNQDVHIGYQ